jgi:hypothetical protein
LFPEILSAVPVATAFPFSELRKVVQIKVLPPLVTLGRRRRPSDQRRVKRLVRR